MRILMLSDVYFPRVNGVSTSIQTFVRHFISLGHEVVLVAPAYPVAHQAEFEILRVPSKKVPFDPEDRLMSLGAVKRLLPALGRRQFDLVHIQTPFVAHYAGMYLARRLDLPVVASYHTFFEAYFDKYLPWLPGGMLRYAARAFSRAQCRQLDCVISPSQQMLNRLRDYGIDGKASVIPTGIPPENFERIEPNHFRAAHGIPESAYLMLYAGRVAHEKNIDFLIDVFSEIRVKHDDVRLLIAGEGPALGRLRKRAADSGFGGDIHFVGYLERRHELLACYQAADTFIFASQTETQGLVLLEAMASGLPVVAVASMGTEDVLVEGEGCLIAPLERGAFAERILALKDAPDLAAELAMSGRRYAGLWRADLKAAEMLALYCDMSGPAKAGVAASL